MAEKFEFQVTEVADLAAKLERFDDVLDQRDRALLVATFTMAGQTLASSGAGLERAPSDGQLRSGSIEERVAALEARVDQLEKGGGLESIDLATNQPTVELSTDGRIPRLSEGFVGSFRPGGPARLAVADDVSVGVNVGVMF